MDEQVKDPTTIDEQIHILSERGMQVDADLARQWLRSVSYYRLSGYWYPYREQLESAPRMPVGRVQLSVYPSFCLKGLMHDE